MPTEESGNELGFTLDAIAKALNQIDRQISLSKAREEEIHGEIGAVRQDVRDFKQDVRTEIDGIKDSQYLEPWQSSVVTEAAKTRVAKILHEWCADNDADWDTVYGRYYGKFVRAVHHDAKKAGLEIGKIIYTPKRNYQMLLNFIGEWYPKRGVKGQMEYYDKIAS